MAVDGESQTQEPGGTSARTDALPGRAESDDRPSSSLQPSFALNQSSVRRNSWLPLQFFEAPAAPPPATPPPQVPRGEQRDAGLHQVLPLFAKRPVTPAVQTASAATVSTGASNTAQTGIRRGSAVVTASPNRLRLRGEGVAKPSTSTSPTSPSFRSQRKMKGDSVRLQFATLPSTAEGNSAGDGRLARSKHRAQLSRIDLPPRLSFIEKELPGTPDALPRTPMEFYQRSPTTPRKLFLARTASSGLSSRSPLRQVSENKFSGAYDDSPISPTSKRGSIAAHISGDENASTPMGPGLPTGKQIHLRGGSVVTVTPPEATAWRRSIYLHGPIKLHQPAIVPRKNSVASLEPFQEAVADLYQDCLVVPRRRSDDAVSDDICDFLDDFGFDAVSFEGDLLAVLDDNLNEIQEEDATVEASPIEVVIAKEALDLVSKSSAIHTPSIPPVETAEALRVRGIARLSRLSAKSAASARGDEREASATSGKPDRTSQSLLHPGSEDAVFHPVSPEMLPGGNAKAYGHAANIGRTSGGSKDRGIEEINVSSTWVAPAVGPQRFALSKSDSVRRSRNPIDRLRRVVATASTAL